MSELESEMDTLPNTIMQTVPNNCYILYYLIDTPKYLTNENNSRICIDDTLWSQCKPVYEQLIILLCTV